METYGSLIFVAGGDDVSAYLRKNFYAAFNAFDIRCTDERHRNFSELPELLFGVKTSKLAAIRIAPYANEPTEKVPQMDKFTNTTRIIRI